MLLSLCLTLLLVLSSSIMGLSNSSYAQPTKSPLPSIVSTRGQFHMMTGRLNPGAGTTSYNFTGPPMVSGYTYYLCTWCIHYCCKL